MSKKAAKAFSEMHPKTLALGIYTPFVKIASPENYYVEFLSLIDTLGLPYDETYYTKVRAVDPNTFFTKGKMSEVQQVVEQGTFEFVIISESLSPLQQRNLEDVFNCEIMGREHLILEIFKKSAHSAEGKIQVEMAEVEFLKTRVIGRDRNYAQQLGVIGTIGPGETATEKMRRVFADKLRQSKQRLDTLQKARDNQRKKRMSSNLPQVCIVGYTNAGKSSLLNRLTKSTALVEDKLFATLDTTTREFFVDSNRKILISDTVGFISNLPHNLIEAFKSTLNELKYADLLMHVVDVSNPEWRGQIEIVQDTLKEIDVEKPVLYVFNKVDLMNTGMIELMMHEFNDYLPHVFVSTKSKEGVKPLVNFLSKYKV
ncbi:MAG: GTPase HflX [candidate division TM6 bacterium GW2011_GWF2_37_49]|nr:MAG: GTPase HflX [candidate division TM6 bacterium GW2011_GWF2_37_49]